MRAAICFATWEGLTSEILLDHQLRRKFFSHEKKVTFQLYDANIRAKLALLDRLKYNDFGSLAVRILRGGKDDLGWPNLDILQGIFHFTKENGMTNYWTKA